MLSGKRYSSWMQMLGIKNVVDLILRAEMTKCLLPPLLSKLQIVLPQTQSPIFGVDAGSSADVWE